MYNACRARFANSALNGDEIFSLGVIIVCAVSAFSRSTDDTPRSLDANCKWNFAESSAIVLLSTQVNNNSISLLFK